MSFKVCVSLLIFCLVDLSIVVSGVLKSPTITVLLLISSFILVSICLTYCGAPMYAKLTADLQSGHYFFPCLKDEDNETQEEVERLA